MEFRANFLAQGGMALVWFGFFALIIFVIFRSTSSLAGWNLGSVLVLSSVSYGVGALYFSFCYSLLSLPNEVRLGSLDFILLKPVDPQFWVSFRRVSFSQIGPVIASAILLPIALHVSHAHPCLIQWMAFLVMCVCAITIFYGFNLILMTMSIWFVRVDNLSVLSDVSWQFGRNPIDIFSKPVQMFFIYLLPLAMFATLPTKQLLFQFDPKLVVVGVVWAIAMATISRVFWLHALRSYSSASS